MKIFISFLSIITIGVYGPLIEILRKNSYIQELYGFTGFDFFILAFLGLILPTMVSGFLAFKFPKTKKFILIFWLFFSVCFFLSSLPLMERIFILIGCSLFSLVIKKDPDGLLKMFLWFAILVLPDSAYKTYFQMKEHLDFGFKSHATIKLIPKVAAPQNIFLFLLDGTDLTSSYLDENLLPRQDLFPHISAYFKKDFLWYPNAVANGPQTQITVPMMMTGKFEYTQSKDDIAQSQEIFSFLSGDYHMNGYFYLNFYRNYCVQHRTNCFPFTDEVETSRPSGSSILINMYAHRLTWGAVKLPFDFGEKFQVEKTPYGMNDLISRLVERKHQKNFFYLHGFARTVHKLKKFDQEFGHLVETLQKLGLYDSSLIILTADHGYDETQTGRKYGQDAKFTPRVFKIPLAVKPIGTGEGKVLPFKAQIIDVASTLLSGVYGDVKDLGLSGVNLLSKPDYKRPHFIYCNKITKAEFFNEYEHSECK